MKQTQTRESGNRLHMAIQLAAEAHKGQKRKCTEIDYLVHPMEVLEILSAVGADTDLKIAGILHDTVEDTGLALSQIRDSFGSDVAELVGKHTEDKSKTWQERKEKGLEILWQSDRRYKMLILADALSNLRSMDADYQQMGEELWKRFKAPKEKQAWYYGEMKAAMVSMGEDADTELHYGELVEIYSALFGDNA